MERTIFQETNPASVSLYVQKMVISIKESEKLLVEIAEAIAYKNKEHLPCDELNAALRSNRIEMDMKTRQLLQYR